MNSSDTLTVQLSVADYQQRVAAALANVASGEREDILSGVGEHLADVASEGADLVSRLGTPEDYARELVAAAGISASPKVGPWFRSPRGAESLRWLREHRRVVEVTEFVPTLRPAWWVLRGYLGVVAIAQLLHADRPQAWSYRLPVVPSVVSGWIGLLLVVAGVWLSVSVGRRQFVSTGKVAVVVSNVILVGVGCYAFFNVNDRIETFSYGSPYAAAPVNQGGLRLNGEPIFNIYPYDAQGRPLSDVQLFDQHGQPLRTMQWRAGQGRVSQGADEFGSPVANVYPRVWVDRNGNVLARQPFDAATSTPALKGQPDNKNVGGSGAAGAGRGSDSK